MRGLSTRQQEADRDIAGEFGEIQDEGSRVVGRSKESAVEHCAMNGTNMREASGGYFHLAEVRKPVLELEKWIHRHIRKYFWLRWHNTRGRLRRLRYLGLKVQRWVPGVCYAIRTGGELTTLCSTAVCGKPHVRWRGSTRPDPGAIGR